MKLFYRNNRIDLIFRIELSYQLRNLMYRSTKSPADIAVACNIDVKEILKALQEKPIYENSMIQIADLLDVSIDKLIVPPFSSTAFLFILETVHSLKSMHGVAFWKSKWEFYQTYKYMFPNYVIRRNKKWLEFITKDERFKRQLARALKPENTSIPFPALGFAEQATPEEQDRARRKVDASKKKR